MLTQNKILYVDTAIVEKLVVLEKGKIFKHPKIAPILIMQNRKTSEREDSPYELVISRMGELFRTEYQQPLFFTKTEKTTVTVKKGKKKEVKTVVDRVIFTLVEPQVQLDVQYKEPQDIEDLYKPEELKFVLDDLIRGVAYVQINKDYAFNNQVVNRKGGTKVECTVLKHDENGRNKLMSTEDIVRVKAILSVMEKIRILDYSITEEIKSGITRVIVKMVIGVEKRNSQQLELGDDKKQEVEKIIVSELEEETIEAPIIEGDVDEVL